VPTSSNTEVQSPSRPLSYPQAHGSYPQVIHTGTHRLSTGATAPMHTQAPVSNSVTT